MDRRKQSERRRDRGIRETRGRTSEALRRDASAFGQPKVDRTGAGEEAMVAEGKLSSSDERKGPLDPLNISNF
jgi:hypothetical protein